MNNLEKREALETRRCEHCGQDYLAVGRGQKGNSSPAVRIVETSKGRKAVGYCSGRCLESSQRRRFEDTLAYRTQADWGVDLNKVSPEGYLAPARRVRH